MLHRNEELSPDSALQPSLQETHLSTDPAWKPSSYPRPENPCDQSEHSQKGPKTWLDPRRESVDEARRGIARP